jgi:hypothetical protein
LIREVLLRTLAGLLGLLMLWGFLAPGEWMKIGALGGLAILLPFALLGYAIGGQKLLRRIAPSLSDKKDK